MRKKHNKANLFGVKKKPCDQVGNGTGRKYPPQEHCQRKVVKPTFVPKGLRPDGELREKAFSSPEAWNQIRALDSISWIPGSDMQISSGDIPWQKCANGLKKLKPGDGIRFRSIHSGKNNKDYGKTSHDTGMDHETHAQMNSEHEHRLNKAGR